MKRTTSKLSLATAAVAAAAMIAAVPASAANPSYNIQKGAYGKRYCELMLVKAQSNLRLHIQVWNTFGLNSCPEAAWKATTTGDALKSLATTNSMDQVSVNGPRWWVFDQIGGVLTAEVKTFGTITMRQAAVLDLGGAPTPFVELTVQRTSTWIYDKGTYVRVLTAPNGRKYAMQAFTTMVNSKVTEKSLNTLASGSKPLLKLPAGWSYKATKLSKQLKIVATGTMTVVQDNLKSTYSRIS
jgi:hypothetical protein